MNSITPSKKRALDECHTPESKIARVSKVQNSPNRKFNESWKVNREWLRLNQSLDLCIVMCVLRHKFLIVSLLGVMC